MLDDAEKFGTDFAATKGSRQRVNALLPETRWQLITSSIKKRKCFETSVKTPPIDMVVTLSDITYSMGSHNDTLRLRTRMDDMRGYNIPGVMFHTSKGILNTSYVQR